MSELDEKLELMIEMLKNRKDVLQKSVAGHYKKQDLFLMEAKKNVERRKNNLEKLSQKLGAVTEVKNTNDHKLERLTEEFSVLNRTFDSPFHQFKHCNINLNP